MMRLLMFACVLPLVAFGDGWKDGPFDGMPFNPAAPIKMASTTKLPQSVTVYRPIGLDAKTTVSNAMAVGGFIPIHLVKSTDTNLIEFRVSGSNGETMRFLKISPREGYLKYYNKDASTSSGSGVPNLDEAQKLALRYFIQLGGNTNEASPLPWRHNQSKITTFTNPNGEKTGEYVASRSILTSRQVEGISVMGNDFLVTFGSDSKPNTIEMRWPRMEAAKRYKVATPDTVVSFVKHGKSFIPLFPPLQEDITKAKQYTIKNVLPLYYEVDGQLKPYASLLVEAEMGERSVDFVVNCPITAEGE